MTSKKNKLEKLEALRGFAALYVVLFHTIPQEIYLFGLNIGILFRFGPEAVFVFFILSGFVIKYSFSRSRDKSFKYYFTRRFIRLYIPLILIFLLGYSINSYSQGMFINPEWTTLLGNLFMLQDVISLKPNVISATYMGNGVLWSLSYEWWFYMLFFFLVKNIESQKLNQWVNILTITAAATYVIYPFTINRFVMYFAIWWIGARFAETYMNNEKFTIRSVMPYASVLLIITVILGVNLYLNFSYTKVYDYPLVAFPFIEFRHFIFSIMVMFGSILWKNLKWFGFNLVFGVFKYIAPCSYVIYISHQYLVVDATYLNFISNKVLEYSLYIIFMIIFSYILEVVIYNRIRKILIG